VPLILLILVFIVLPIAELYVIIQVGQAIGILPTIALLLVDGFLGAALARSQGRLAWRRFNEALAAGRVPAKEVYDGAAIIFGGALLLSPGFITDFLGVFLLLPPTRGLLRRTLVGTARRVGPARAAFYVYDRRPGGRSGPARPPGGNGQPPPRRAPRTYDVEGTATEVPDDPGELGSGEGGRG
jgi:UPF0716 protein FxsA